MPTQSTNPKNRRGKPPEKEPIISSTALGAGYVPEYQRRRYEQFSSPVVAGTKGGTTACAAKCEAFRNKKQIPVVDVNPSKISAVELKRLQHQDSMLQKFSVEIGKKVLANAPITQFETINGVLYVRYRLPSGKEITHHVVPVETRGIVLKMAHEGTLGDTRVSREL